MRNLVDSFTNMTFVELIKNPEYSQQCAEFYLPESPDIDERIFIKTDILNFKDPVPKLIVFIVFDKNKKILTESAYYFAELPNNGYIMRLEYARPFSQTSVTISYITDLNIVHLTSETVNDTIFRTIDSSNYLGIINELDIVGDVFYNKYIVPHISFTGIS